MNLYIFGENRGKIEGSVLIDIIKVIQLCFIRCQSVNITERLSTPLHAYIYKYINI